MKWKLHDWVFAIGGLLLCAGSVPALFHQIHTPIWSAALTVVVLFGFTVNYITIKYRWTAITTGVQVILWILILIEAMH